MPWSARACSGDAVAVLLQPQQVLIAQEDAACRSVKQLDLVRVLFASRSSVLLECVVDRRAPAAALAGGRIQLHPWVLDACGQLEDASATLETVEPAASASPSSSWRLSLSVRTKFPRVAAASGSDSGDGGLQLGDPRTHLLPESVRRRQIDLEGAVMRQLRAAGTLRAPRKGQLVPVRLLGDTYVFRVDSAARTDEASHVVVKGWSDAGGSAVTEEEQADTAVLATQVEALSIQEEAQSSTPSSLYESELSARLWQAGFAGYTAFVQDVLFNLALVLKRGQNGPGGDSEMEQIGSHGILISGVNGVGKSLALVALQRELVRERIGTWRVDGMSLLMGAESAVFPTAYEYLTHELEQKFPELGSLRDGQRMDKLLTVPTDSSHSLVRTGRFGKVLDLDVPTEQSRREILRRHLIGLPLRSDKEIATWCESAEMRLLKLTQISSVMVAVQKQLFDFVSWKFHPTDAMNRLSISNASGILLSGPSGCGKTLLVQTLAAQAQVNFVSVKSSELLSKYFGDSEKGVRQLFARARAAAPCLLFFDEFDSIAHKRSFGEGDGGSSGGGVYARVLSTFLNEMDGRIDKTVELGFPTQEDIEKIFALYTRKMPLAADVDIQALSGRPRGSRMFTGADIAAICKEAAFRALREDIEAKTVCLRHFEAAWDQRAEATSTHTPATANPESLTNPDS
ncbi:Cell division cycle protein 48 [Phytophthora cinnamomi]|uniref:Cell division cycle protein 48 n=1 Tax=Phytophthora cinnamomi TaxID=4785 RepID=UPI00355A6A81|nr:Cell division cycle protein 48 [Phytophthora cinnamomi]